MRSQCRLENFVFSLIWASVSEPLSSGLNVNFMISVRKWPFSDSALLHLHYSVLGQTSAVLLPQLETLCPCGSRTAEYFSGEKHSATVVTEQQNFCLVRNILLLW